MVDQSIKKPDFEGEVKHINTYKDFSIWRVEPLRHRKMWVICSNDGGVLFGPYYSVREATKKWNDL
jgi:hypothetical protein